jgi:hypothetical protein
VLGVSLPVVTVSLLLVSERNESKIPASTPPDPVAAVVSEQTMTAQPLPSMKAAATTEPIALGPQATAELVDARSETSE